MKERKPKNLWVCYDCYFSISRKKNFIIKIIRKYKRNWWWICKIPVTTPIKRLHDSFRVHTVKIIGISISCTRCFYELFHMNRVANILGDSHVLHDSFRMSTLHNCMQIHLYPYPPLNPNVRVFWKISRFCL